MLRKFLGADPEIRTCDGWTALHCAAFWANYEVVAILLRHGVNVNSRTEISKVVFNYLFVLRQNCSITFGN